MGNANRVELTAQAKLPTQYGDFILRSFQDCSEQMSQQLLNNNEAPILCLSLGLEANKTPLVRVHSECITGEVFGSLRCECSQQLDLAMEKIAAHGCGVIVYLRQEGRGIGIENKIRAYALQDQGLDTVDANVSLGLPVDNRDFSSAAFVLTELGVKQCSLLTNNPEKTASLISNGIEIVDNMTLLVESQHPSCRQYLDTKKTRLGHRL